MHHNFHRLSINNVINGNIVVNPEINNEPDNYDLLLSHLECPYLNLGIYIPILY